MRDRRDLSVVERDFGVGVGDGGGAGGGGGGGGAGAGGGGRVSEGYGSGRSSRDADSVGDFGSVDMGERMVGRGGRFEMVGVREGHWSVGVVVASLIQG